MSKLAGKALAQGIHKRVVQHYVVKVLSIDWARLRAVVEFKADPGLTASARIMTMSGKGGTLYPPIDTGDLMWAEVSGQDLDQLLQSRVSKGVTNPYFFDKSTVAIGFSVHADTGEPAGRLATAPPVPGGWLLVSADGSEIRNDPTTGVWTWKIPEGGKLYLGGSVNPKAVAVHGDPISGGFGTVDSSQNSIYIGSPS